MPSIPLSPGMTTSISTTSGFLLPRLEDRCADIAGLADDLDVVLGVEQQVQAGPDDGVVVDDQHPDRPSLVIASGTSATIVVPDPRSTRSRAYPRAGRPAPSSRQTESVPSPSVARSRDRRPRRRP